MQDPLDGTHECFLVDRFHKHGEAPFAVRACDPPATRPAGNRHDRDVPRAIALVQPAAQFEPVDPGQPESVTMIAGSRSRAFSTACSPLWASMTSNPCWVSISAYSFRVERSSSTTRYPAPLGQLGVMHSGRRLVAEHRFELDHPVRIRMRGENPAARRFADPASRRGRERREVRRYLVAGCGNEHFAAGLEELLDPDPSVGNRDTPPPPPPRTRASPARSRSAPCCRG